MKKKDDVKKIAEVVDITTASKDRNKIVLTNFEVFSLLNQGPQGMSHPIKVSFDTLSKAACVDGLLQTKIYKVTKEMIALFKDIEDLRVKFVKQCADKDEKGEPKMREEYQFDPPQRAAFTKELNDIQKNIALSQQGFDVLAEKYCQLDDKGKPVKKPGANYALSEEGMKEFNKLYNDMMKAENALAANRIQIGSELLNKMNAEQRISIDDMVMLDKIFEFVE